MGPNLRWAVLWYGVSISGAMFVPGSFTSAARATDLASLASGGDTEAAQLQLEWVRLAEEAAQDPNLWQLTDSPPKENSLGRLGARLQAQNPSPSIPPNAPAPPQVDPQADPNRDRFPQPAPDPEPTLPQEEEPPLDGIEAPPGPTPTEEPSAEPDADRFLIKKIEIVDSTVLTPEDIQQIVGDLEGTEVTIEEVRKVADQITQLYLDRGYITSRAILGDQEIEDGVVRITVIEGVLEDIEVEGTKRIRPFYIRNRIALGAESPLSTASLEDQLRLLRLDPLFENIEASLRAGEDIGQSILTVRAREASPFFTNFSIDNFSPPSVGSERFGGNVRIRNLTGIGDEISAAYFWSNGDSQVYDFSYRAPINAMNGTIQLRVAPNQNEIVQEPFDEIGIGGESELYELSYRQPLVRSPRQEFALSLGFTHQESQTFTSNGPTPFGFGPDEDGISRTSTIKFGQDYLRRDSAGAWSFRSQFSLGTGWLDATINANPVPDSRFLSWTGQVQRVQRLGSRQLLIVQGDLQLTPNSLLSSQQFVIGGGGSLRGYRQNVRSGDNGFRFSIEDRITIQRDSSGLPVFQVAPFFDMGGVWNNGDNPNTLPDETFLMGIGAGILWQPAPGLNIRVDYGVPLIDISDRGNNAQDEGFYFSINYGL